LTSNGIRFADVTACRFTFRSLRTGRLLDLVDESSGRSHGRSRSLGLVIEVYENGIDDSR